MKFLQHTKKNKLPQCDGIEEGFEIILNWMKQNNWHQNDDLSPTSKGTTQNL